MDFPRAWEITRESKMEDHHIDCSWRQAGMLCDCNVLYKHPDYLAEQDEIKLKDRLILSFGDVKICLIELEDRIKKLEGQEKE